MSSTVPENTMRAMIEARQESRHALMVSYSKMTVGGLADRAQQVGLNPVDFNNSIALITALVDKMLPPLDVQVGSKSEPQRFAPHGGTVDLTVPITTDAEGVFNYLDNRGSTPVPYNQTRPDAETLAAMGRAVRSQALEWPGDSPNQWGGVDLLDVVRSAEPGWWDDRFFVGFRDNGHVVKLDVQAIETMSGQDFAVEFGAAAEPPHRVVIVHIPSWWLDAEYVARAVKTAFFELQRGAPDQAYRALRTFCTEQNWIDEGLAPDVSQPLIENLAKALVADIETAALTGDIENVRHAIQTIQRQRGWIEHEAAVFDDDKADTKVIPIFEGVDPNAFEARVQANQDERISQPEPKASGEWGPWGKDGRPES